MATRKSIPPVITLLTDFGLSDHYVGVMKGVIYGICPEARIVDISHDVAPFEISQGAFLLDQSWRWFPANTIHVAIVDPGVGTARRPILIEAHGHRFIGPDNGVLAMVYAEAEHTAREITSEKYFLPAQSRTFHGRDVFAPAAAHLAAGAKPSTFGEEINDHLRLAFYKPQRTSKRHWSGTILHIDRFGNLITNFRIDEFPDVRTKPFEVIIGPRHIHRLALTFAEVEPGELFVIVGSSGYLEVASNQASAAKLVGCGPGAPVDLALF